MYGYDQNSSLYQEAYRRVMHRIDLRMRLLRHVFSYISLCIILVGIYVIMNWDRGFDIDWASRPWFIWPLGIIGILTVIDIVKLLVFENSRMVDQQQMIAEEMQKMGTNPPAPRY